MGPIGLLTGISIEHGGLGHVMKIVRYIFLYAEIVWSIFSNTRERRLRVLSINGSAWCDR